MSLCSRVAQTVASSRDAWRPTLCKTKVRRQWRWLAGLATFALVLAQVITVAHACGFSTGASHTAAALSQSTGKVMPPDCKDTPKHVSADAKVCETHCTYGQQIDVQPIMPVAAIAPLPALYVSPGQAPPEPLVNPGALRGRTTAPPALLLFGRFLI
jgi:hypothetical protein